MKTYKKVEVVAKNATSGSYVAGCPAKDARGYDGSSSCKGCERSK